MQPRKELRRGAQMPKALSGEMLANPFVVIDRPEHHRFDRRVKARAPNPRASGATLRGMLPQVAAILEDCRNSC